MALGFLMLALPHGADALLKLKTRTKLQMPNHLNAAPQAEDDPLPAAHFAVHKNWTKTLGYLAPVSFWHWHVDSYTQKVARKLGRCLYLPTVTFKAKKIINDNAGKQIRKNFNINYRDNFVWTKVRDRHLQTDVNLLKEKINVIS